MRIHHVNVVVGPGLVPATADFWREVFGLTDLPRQGRSGRPGAWLSTGEGAGSFEVHVSERDDSAHSDAHVAIAVDDVAVIRERCVDRGADWEEATALFGSGRGFTRDPGGNRIEVVHDVG